MNNGLLPTRKDFLLAMAGATLLPAVLPAETAPRKLLIVVAHPDDEYAFAATTYRLVRECGWTADQVVITNGESGYRYAALAETFYGVSLAATGEGRANLSEIRKKEARNAGRILGIREFFFSISETSASMSMRLLRTAAIGTNPTCAGSCRAL